jgi:CheY-like chemotaxis protein
VRSHHGTIQVESELAKGTAFSVYLPLWANAPTTPRPEHALAEPVAGSSRVLVVDDEEIIRATAAGMLQRLGYSAVTCASGPEAVEYYRDAWRDVDLVLLDLMMPELSGVETFARLRAINPDARIVITSGYSLNAQVQALLDGGAAGFVGKPFELADFSQVLADAVKR